jgi:hypothetical protein
MVVIAGGCGETISAPDIDSAEIQGFVTQLNQSGGFLVEEDPTVSDPTLPGGRKIWFSIGTDAETLAIQADGTLRSTALIEIHVSDRVAVWSTGLMLPSYPASATASRIVILR